MSHSPLAIVSGATGGIGGTVARYLWQSGYSLIALGRTPEKVHQLHGWFTEHPRENQYSRCFVCDVGDDSHYAQLDTTCAILESPPSLLAVCHGHAPIRMPGLSYGARVGLRDVFETDIMGTHKLCQSVAPLMRKAGGGSIAIVSSIHAHATYPHRVPYSVIKSAMGGLVRGLALDLGNANIRINAVCPWQVQSPRTAQVMSHEGEDTLERYLGKSPLRRLVDPLDVAKTILWLAECQSITGTEIIVDCGVSASMWHRPFDPINT